MLLTFLHTHLTEAGLDEAGRGCFAGPVYAAAVILPKDFYHPLLNDSKKLNEKQRDLLRPIIEKESIAFAVAAIDNNQIDKINILKTVGSSVCEQYYGSKRNARNVTHREDFYPFGA